MEIVVPKYSKLGQGFSKKEIISSYEDPGRPWNRPAGGWIGDLTELRKFILLCPYCSPKFNPRQNQYEVWRAKIESIGKCDGCKQVSTYLKGYIHQSAHDLCGEWQHPRKGRWA